jgi:phage FluMu protein Com
MDRTFEPFRCRTCQKLLLKITPVALKAGAALEIKCGCKTMNYMMGRDQ